MNLKGEWKGQSTGERYPFSPEHPRRYVDAQDAVSMLTFEIAEGEFAFAEVSDGF